MQGNWFDFLQHQNAEINNKLVIHFGDLQAELKHTQVDTVLVDLSHYGLLSFTGDDVQDFLQNQLSCDVREITPYQAQYGCYCTPKGRVLTNFVLLQKDDEWILQLPEALCAVIQKRLSMFILHSKVVIRDISSHWIRIGVTGSAACDLVEVAMEMKLDGCSHLQVTHTPQASIICHRQDQVEIIASESNARRLWLKLCEQIRLAGTVCWQWKEIRAGIPTVTTATQEQFLPQMLNLDLIDGISFEKGCYPGQEIIARTKYLGKLKRRLYLAHVATDHNVTEGSHVFCADTQDQPCGTIVNSVPSPHGGYDVLAVIQQSSVASGDVFWQKPGGIPLRIGTLSYSLD